MKCKVAAVAGATLMLACAPGSASAHVTSFDNGFDARLEPFEQTGFFVSGVMFSEKQQCLANRTIKFSAIGGTGQTSDLDRSSTHGAFAGALDVAGSNGVKVKIVKKDIGRRRHVHLCESYVESLFVP